MFHAKGAKFTRRTQRGFFRFNTLPSRQFICALCVKLFDRSYRDYSTPGKDSHLDRKLLLHPVKGKWVSLFRTDYFE